ncbi:hypothetical protein CKO12_12045 [Chromatium okenii]|uniref:hypothetical protein n=1 Tax=Chromatium okenii TaxID=61644 RepID=UPI001903FDFC|nr:hypothetical protein [Chromatium okenii]MBK1642594.1 hypothetical protein [Chromatium okenii]
MSRKQHDHLSSRELLARIGLNNEHTNHLLDDDPLDDLTGDLGAALRDRYQLFQQPHNFAVGDLVTWKPGLKNRRLPRYANPAIVVEVLQTPVLDCENDSASTYFREPLNLVLGMFYEEGAIRGEFLTWHYDSRRFQLWTEK